MAKKHMAKEFPMLEHIQNLVRDDLTARHGSNEAGVALRDLYNRESKFLAQLYSGLLSIRKDHLIEENTLPTLSECLEKIRELERHPLPKHSFASIYWRGSHRGIYVSCEKLQGGGLVYSITLMTHEDRLEQVVHGEFRAAYSQPEPFATICTVDGWIAVPRDQLSEFPELLLMLQALAAIHGFIYQKISLKALSVADVGSLAPPKRNHYLERLCMLAYKNRLECTRAIVSMSSVVPNDMEFALSYPLDEIRNVRGFHFDGSSASTELLLYQKGGKLIMDDDYSAYLSYKSLGLKRVPAVILGKFHMPDIEIIESGLSDLMPLIRVRKHFPQSSLSLVDEQHLERRLKEIAPSRPSHVELLTRTYFEFSHLLERRRKKEADLHAFLKKHPFLIDAHAASIHSEVRVGSFRADLVLRYKQSDKRVLLIELELDDDKIFKKNNRLFDKINHAAQQIEDWITEIKRNSDAMPPWLRGEYDAAGLVVVGRSQQLTEDQKQTLFNLNANRSVKILTYDDLLERLNRLIGSLEQAVNT